MSWYEGPLLNQPRAAHGVVAIDDMYLVAVGGEYDATPLTSVEFLPSSDLCGRRKRRATRVFSVYWIAQSKQIATMFGKVMGGIGSEGKGGPLRRKLLVSLSLSPVCWRVLACPHTEARRQTDRRARVEVGEAHSLRRHLVEMRRLDVLLAEASKVAVAQIVGHEK